MSIKAPHFSDDPDVQAEFEASFAEGVSAERARIHSILGYGASASIDRPELAKHIAFGTTLSVSEARQMLALSAEGTSKTRGQISTLFADAMAAIKNPDIRAEIDGGEDGESAQAIARRIAGMNPSAGG